MSDREREAAGVGPDDPPHGSDPSGTSASQASEAGGRGADEGADEPGLEGRLQRLDRILAHMESDDVELEEALRLFEEGVAHVRRAERILAETELRVEELLAHGTEPMDLEES